MVDYSMFLEDCDLLEAIGIEKIISENCEDLLDEYISESEMLINIYETQRFMIEQDTEIFMSLKYTPIHEGVLSKIWNGILSILRKIKDNIMKFIRFITGQRKKDSKNIKIEISNKEKTENLKILNSSLSKEIQSLLDRMPNDDSSNKIKEILNNMINEVEDIHNDKRYNLLAILQNNKELDVFTFERIEDSKIIAEYFETINEVFSILKDDNIVSELDKCNSLDDVKNLLRNTNYFNKISSIFENESDKDTFSRIDNEVKFNNFQIVYRKNFLSYGDYIKKIDFDNKLFSEYKNQCTDIINQLKKDIDNKITPLEKQVENLSNIRETNNGCKLLINRVSRNISVLSHIYTQRIEILTRIEHMYNLHLYNTNLYKKDSEKLTKISKNLEKYKEIYREL